MCSLQVEQPRQLKRDKRSQIQVCSAGADVNIDVEVQLNWKLDWRRNSGNWYHGTHIRKTEKHGEKADQEQIALDCVVPAIWISGIEVSDKMLKQCCKNGRSLP